MSRNFIVSQGIKLEGIKYKYNFLMLEMINEALAMIISCGCSVSIALAGLMV